MILLSEVQIIRVRRFVPAEVLFLRSLPEVDLISAASTTVKMAVFAPMPSASVSTAIMVKAGLFASVRML
jgi:hypothetical protein